MPDQAKGQFNLHSWDEMWALLSLITLRKCGAQADHYLALCRDVEREEHALEEEARVGANSGASS